MSRDNVVSVALAWARVARLYVGHEAGTCASKERNVISRQWRGLARAERAQDYIRHLRTETFPALRRIAGFIDASILSRTLATGVEFQIVTRWDSVDAIVRFAGADPEVSVVPQHVVEMMIEYDPKAKHFEVIGSSVGGVSVSE
jgi:heme-degrading monooxygenase HmoA